MRRGSGRSYGQRARIIDGQVARHLRAQWTKLHHQSCTTLPLMVYQNEQLGCSPVPSAPCSTTWACRTATYIDRRKPAKALDGRTYYEMLYNLKLDLANLRAFRCAVCHRRTEREIEGTCVDCGLGYKHQRGACDAAIWRWSGQASPLWANQLPTKSKQGVPLVS